MTIGAPILEVEVLVIGLFVLMVEAFFERIEKRTLAYTAIFGLAGSARAVFLAPPSADIAKCFWSSTRPIARDFCQTLRARHTILVLVMMIDYAPILRESIHGTTNQSGPANFSRCRSFLRRLMWMAYAIDFVMIFVSLELGRCLLRPRQLHSSQSGDTEAGGVKY